MNATTPQTNPLERVAARGLEQRRSEQLEAGVKFFSAALRDLPLELRLATRLVSSSTDWTHVRLQIAGQPFDLETTFSRHHEVLNKSRLYHAGLALSEAITKLEDYSRERASAQSQTTARQELGWLGLTMLGSLGFMGLCIAVGCGLYGFKLPDLGFTIGFALFLTALISAARAVEHGRILTVLFPARLEPVNSALREGFERWQQPTLETTAALTTAFQTKESK